MEKTILSGTTLEISPIALGTDNFGVSPDKGASESLIKAFLDAGGNLLDTALIYSDWTPGERGRSEKLIGSWLYENKKRKDVVISTKGAFPSFEHPELSRLSPSEIEGDMDKSLLNLKTDYVDIYWLHRDDESLEVDEIMDCLNSLVSKGKTRYFGMSNWKSYRIKRANDYAKAKGLNLVSASQIQYSIAKPIEEAIDPTLVFMDDTEYGFYKETKMPVFAFSAQAKGFFSKIDAGGEKGLSPKARDRYLREENLKMYGRLKEVTESYGMTIGQGVIAALLSNEDFMVVPIVGCKTESQLKDSLKGADFSFTREELRYILL